MVVELTLEPVVWLRKHLEQADADLLRAIVRTLVQALMSAEADAICGAPYGERTNRRNGYREREWDSQAGTIELQIPKLRTGSYFPSWLLERHRRAERALVQVVAECYVGGASTRRVDLLIKTLGISGISPSQSSASSPTGPRSSGSWAPRSANSTMSGPHLAATWVWSPSRRPA
jgi:transposase-like protein